ncbi:hypothetical protein PILCRDRAFT_462643 [Piloderma croceum F 1598]|uniref:Uncharacterized protein n=1 Tax=Piloderma croceum (strain F 1598) TaxID=765440 RepID=A0A0C3FRS2_PILCF|nr:hypothetical protein PILCRDRAFT_462643 [Piloderma croceum F 1598]
MVRAYTIRDRQTRFGLATDIRCVFQLFRYDSGICLRYCCGADTKFRLLAVPRLNTNSRIYVSLYRSHSNHPLSQPKRHLRSHVESSHFLSYPSSALSTVAAWLMDKSRMLSYPIRIHRDCHGRGFVSQDQTSNVTLSGAFVMTSWNKLSVNHLSDVREHRRVRLATPLTPMSDTP